MGRRMGTAIMEIGVEVSQKTKNRSTTWEKQVSMKCLAPKGISTSHPLSPMPQNLQEGLQGGTEKTRRWPATRNHFLDACPSTHEFKNSVCLPKIKPVKLPARIREDLLSPKEEPWRVWLQGRGESVFSSVWPLRDYMCSRRWLYTNAHTGYTEKTQDF